MASEVAKDGTGVLRGRGSDGGSVTMAETDEKTIRVVFDFDVHSYNALKRLKEAGHHGSLGEAVRAALQESLDIQDLFEEGFTQILARNPRNRRKRLVPVKSQADSETALE